MGTTKVTINVPISEMVFPALIEFAQRHEVGLTVTGPETPLSESIVDAFEAEGLNVFGPSRKAAGKGGIV